MALGATTAIFDSVLSNGQRLEYTLRPYVPIFWFAFASAGVSVFLVPFLTIGTQGGKSKSANASMDAVPVGTSNTNMNALSSTANPPVSASGTSER